MTSPGLPLVSVVTPTWQRHEPLLTRCAQSVGAQDYPLSRIEHVIASDGPDPDLSGLLFESAPWPRPGTVKIIHLPEHEPALHWGAPARKAGAAAADGELIAYLDDDDAYRPEHIRLLAEALIAAPDAMFVVGRMMSHQPGGDSVIGDGPLGFGNVGTPMIMHRRELLDLAGWDVSSPGEDWEIVSRWLGAGAAYVRVDAETVDVWPSTFWHGKL